MPHYHGSLTKPGCVPRHHRRRRPTTPPEAAVFSLSIEQPGTASVSVHPSREVAHAELGTYLDETGHRLRVTQASWTHTCYEFVGGSGGQIMGHAVIDEICRCTHPERELDETGCTAAAVDNPLAQCTCLRHEPVSGDPTLFAVEMPT